MSDWEREKETAWFLREYDRLQEAGRTSGELAPLLEYASADSLRQSVHQARQGEFYISSPHIAAMRRLAASGKERFAAALRLTARIAKVVDSYDPIMGGGERVDFITDLVNAALEAGGPGGAGADSRDT